MIYRARRCGLSGRASPSPRSRGCRRHEACGRAHRRKILRLLQPFQITPLENFVEMSGDHAHDVGFLHDQEFFAVQFDFGARPLAEQHPIAGLDVDWNKLPGLVAAAGADSNHLPFLRFGLAGCAPGPQPAQPAAPAVVQTLPPAFPPQDIVGRWGLAAYHKEEDRARTEQAAAGGCKQPYVIVLGPNGGVMMHLADEATPTELRLKGAPGGKTFIGPADSEPGGAQDREVVAFNGRVLILRWMDSEVQGRYGTMVYVRCGGEGAKRPAAKPKPKPRTAPPPPKPAQ